jgi:hypothetical protein
MKGNRLSRPGRMKELPNGVSPIATTMVPVMWILG